MILYPKAIRKDMIMMGTIQDELDRILDFYNINLDRDDIKKDILELIENVKQDAYLRSLDTIKECLYSPDYSGTIGGSSLND